MTLNEYIEHPLGKGNTLNAGMRVLYTDIYKTKFANIMLRELSKIDTFAYFDKTAKYLHIKVPSEVVENLYYDEKVQVNRKKAQPSLEETEVSILSFIAPPLITEGFSDYSDARAKDDDDE